MSWPRYHYPDWKPFADWRPPYPYWNSYRHWMSHRHYRGGSMFGRLFFFLVGVYAGVVANQRYRLPPAPTPCGGHHHEHRSDSRSRLDEYPELKEAIEKLKAFEKRYRKHPPNEERAAPPTTSSAPPSN
ncbi:unnamed protein product [Lymnaea stagnalis]|uniref:Uncharacterized protein n=1 Tax=Lymnaea stagnalis TaxID=6523 RepID=A0AAV2HVD3_LYMST